MKTNIILLITFLSCLKMSGQYSISNSTQEADENVNTSNNTTRINLFNIEFNGTSIPINIVYSHNGVKISESKKSLGYTWQIEEIGKINSIVNDHPDSQGWFIQPDIDYGGYYFYDTCQSSCPSNFNVHSPQGDLSPDFFSCSTSNGLNFDFFYKKNYPNSPTPKLLTNDPGYKVETNFSNFPINCISNNNIVFNILDPEGSKYEFINGPILFDTNRGGSTCRNDYYLQAIRNSNNTEVVSIQYDTQTAVRAEYYKVGFNGSGYGNDYDSDIVNNFAMDYYWVDESRFDIKKIIYNKGEVNFVYQQDGHLDEINVFDLNGKYITGYKFIYNLQETGADLLWQIKKYTVGKTQSDIIYQFEYYYDYPVVETLFGSSNNQYEDFLGYCNGIYKDNPFPFPVRVNSNLIKPAGNFTPNLGYAKQLSLKKIVNKYGGTTEFDYKLNFESHPHFGDMYGGGLMIQSVTVMPATGVGKTTWYDYQDLTGYVFLTNNINYHYIRNYNNHKFYTQVPLLDNPNDSFVSEPYQDNLQEQGNFFKRVIETTWDLANPLVFQSQNVKDFVRDYTGLFCRPIIKKETYHETDYGNIIKTNEYNYSYEVLANIDRATFKTEVRTTSAGVNIWVNVKAFEPISVNRVKLVSEKKTTLNNQQTIEAITRYYYSDANTTRLSSVFKTESFGADLETKYFYSDSPSISGEPNISELISKNIIGIPLVAQTFKGGEKLMEEKTSYAKDISTSNLLLPKFKFYKKGEDSSVNLFKKKMSYDLYDSNGNLLQFTTENGSPTSIIWGYNKTVPIAVLKNVNYSGISQSSIVNLITKSNEDDDNCLNLTCKQEVLRSSLNSLRNDFPYAMIYTTTYDPIIGITSETDPKGDVLFYEYDEYNRLKILKDRDFNIIKENQYHFSTQN